MLFVCAAAGSAVSRWGAVSETGTRRPRRERGVCDGHGVWGWECGACDEARCPRREQGVRGVGEVSAAWARRLRREARYPRREAGSQQWGGVCGGRRGIRGGGGDRGEAQYQRRGRGVCGGSKVSATGTASVAGSAVFAVRARRPRREARYPQRGAVSAARVRRVYNVTMCIDPHDSLRKASAWLYNA